MGRRRRWDTAALVACLLALPALVAGTDASLSRQEVLGGGFYFPQNISYGLDPDENEVGPWGPWTESSECSRTCGGGVAFQTRICMDVKTDGTYSCRGSSRRYFSCNTEACPEGSQDFRELQCARFNTFPFGRIYYSWIPYYKAPNPCELDCMPRGERFYYTHDKKVIDGTPCYLNGSRDICIDGICTPVGCDLILGSTTVEDQCRVCGGNGTTCRLVEGIFDSNDFQVGYNDLHLIPAGVTHIEIQELFPTSNYLALRDLKGRYHLNGYWTIENAREIDVAGTTFHYERKSQDYLAPESLRALGPTTEPLYLVLLYKTTNLGISYEYYLPTGPTPPPPDSYVWNTGDFGNCSSACGGGEHSREVICTHENTGDTVEDSLCDSSMRPDTNQTCNTEPCTATWFTGEWGECYNPETSGVEQRLVFCAQQLADNKSSVAMVDEELCEGQEKPESLQDCVRSENDTMVPGRCGVWQPGDWSECTGDCGEGKQTRKLNCTLNGEMVSEARCPEETPEVEQTCMLPPCREGLDWVTSEWSGCEDGCGLQVETRHVLCSTAGGVVFPSEKCDLPRRPTSSRVCESILPCEASWFATEWSKCTTACGNGFHTRQVVCGYWDASNHTFNILPEDHCFPEVKPLDKEPCESYTNCTGIWFSGPWTRCSSRCQGERLREVFCLEKAEPKDSCDPATKPAASEPCILDIFGGDEMIAVGGCNDTALLDLNDTSVFDFNDTIPTEAIPEAGCSLMKFGCCPDAITPAQGPFKAGCFTPKCEDSEFGCCEDGVNAAKGPGMKGCPPACELSEWGCCSDGITPASGENATGCDMGSGDMCGEHGCCPDGVTPASGPNGKGCRRVICVSTGNDTFAGSGDGGMLNCTEIEGSGDLTCQESVWGCCPDGLTAAEGPDSLGCILEDCSNSTFGCCQDNVTSAKGPDMEGCECMNLKYGCCPDTITPAVGPGWEGCILECENSTFGCCQDNLTFATGPNFEGCDQFLDCNVTTFGCCLDNVTVALGPNFEGCEENVTDCLNTTFGCCPDNMTAAMGENMEGCEMDNVTSCLESLYGCCSDNTTAASGPGLEGCDNVTRCQDSTYGCCPDNTTLATGPSNEGCEETKNCMEMVYGCCPDGITPARGSNQDGCCFVTIFGCCPDNLTAAVGPGLMGCGCQTYPHGCCPDGITPAHGPRYFGCTCRHYPYGCCQDNHTPARGPNFDGCLCERMLFKCCEDGVTPAIGLNGEGCRCEQTQHGCCPDDRTPATGPNYQGCPCTTLPYGCCPDGRTPARGYDMLGCPCDSLPYGCCRDNYTPAKGPGYQGCPCSTMPYGCCPDGVTAAVGPNNLGCPDIVHPIHDYRACHLPKETGPCQDYKVKYYFDLAYGGCSRFWYGGCEGNTNLFNTQESCEDTCVKPEGAAACSLPKVTGPCEDTLDSWFYDIHTSSCQQFVYGGCLGNNNRFVTRDQCQATCGRHVQPPVPPPTDVCQLPRADGNCGEAIPSWFFDAVSGRCLEFFYTGCGGNLNRFASFEHCRQRCQPTVETTTTAVVPTCHLPRDTGPCNTHVILWYFNPQAQRCEQFYYGGCGGNSNRFTSRELCEHSCIGPPPQTTAISADRCSLSHEVGNCFDYTERWFYDHQYGQCRSFRYSGCGGNANNFASLDQCREACSRGAPLTTTPATLTSSLGLPSFTVESCFLDHATGPCTQNELHWYYDKADGVCKEFYYGGCEGNDNRFVTRRECESRCGRAQDLCTLPKAKGSCRGSFTQFFYDFYADECREFEFSGCQGNANRFDNRELCEQSCRQRRTTTTSVAPPLEDTCLQPYDPGSCHDLHTQWYYDSLDNLCKSFVYTGCGGNSNRFTSRRECQASCMRKATQEPGPPPGPPPPPRDPNAEVCRLPAEPGPCDQPQPRFFYDPSTQSCLTFTYSGCGGNKNRFKAIDTCQRFCSNVMPSDKVGPTPGCPLSNCQNLHCPFGMQEVRSAEGCSSCHCLDPCENVICPYGSKCVIEETRPQCRPISKPGQCPPPQSYVEKCDQVCREDAECSGEAKCCYTEACTYTCVQPYVPVEPAPTPKPGICPPTSDPLTCEQSRQCHDDRDCSGTDRCCYSDYCRYVCRPILQVFPPSPSPAVPTTSSTEATVDDAERQLGSTGSEILMRCSPDGPTHGTIWAREGRPIDFTDLRLRPYSDGSLQIIFLEEKDSALYACSGTDAQGQPVSRRIRLRVVEQAQVEVSLDTPDYRRGSPIQLSCRVRGTPPVTVTWYRGTVPLAPGTTERYQLRPDHTLYIPRAEVDDSGPYHCTAKNEFGQASDSIQIQVEDSTQPEECQDHPQFKGCSFVVKANYCSNKDYFKYCCSSCTKAGYPFQPSS